MVKVSKRQGYQRHTGSVSQRQLDKVLIAIWSEYDRRRPSSFAESDIFSRTKSENAKYFLMREIYALGLHIIAKQPRFSPQDLINMRRNRNTTRPEFSPGTFHALFMATFKEDDQISRSERWLMARELKYASRHNIRPELLCGFLLQSGTRKEINKKLDQGYIEPAFRKLLDND